MKYLVICCYKGHPGFHRISEHTNYADAKEIFDSIAADPRIFYLHLLKAETLESAGIGKEVEIIG